MTVGAMITRRPIGPVKQCARRTPAGVRRDDRRQDSTTIPRLTSPETATDGAHERDEKVVRRAPSARTAASAGTAATCSASHRRCEHRWQCHGDEVTVRVGGHAVLAGNEQLASGGRQAGDDCEAGDRERRRDEPMASERSSDSRAHQTKAGVGTSCSYRAVVSATIRATENSSTRRRHDPQALRARQEAGDGLSQRPRSPTADRPAPRSPSSLIPLARVDARAGPTRALRAQPEAALPTATPRRTRPCGVPASRVVPGADEVHASAEAHLVDRPLDLARQRSVPHAARAAHEADRQRAPRTPEQCDWVLCSENRPTAPITSASNGSPSSWRVAARAQSEKANRSGSIPLRMHVYCSLRPMP